MRIRSIESTDRKPARVAVGLPRSAATGEQTAGGSVTGHGYRGKVVQCYGIR